MGSNPFFLEKHEVWGGPLSSRAGPTDLHNRLTTRMPRTRVAYHNTTAQATRSQVDAARAIT